MFDASEHIPEMDTATLGRLRDVYAHLLLPGDVVSVVLEDNSVIRGTVAGVSATDILLGDDTVYLPPRSTYEVMYGVLPGKEEERLSDGALVPRARVKLIAFRKKVARFQT